MQILVVYFVTVVALGIAGADNITLYYGYSGIVLNYNYTQEYLKEDSVQRRNLSRDIFEGFAGIYTDDRVQGSYKSKYHAELLNITAEGVYLSQPSRRFSGNFSNIEEQRNKKNFHPERGIFFVTILRFEYDVEYPGGSEQYVTQLRRSIINTIWYFLRLQPRPMYLGGKVHLNDTAFVAKEILSDDIHTILESLHYKYGFPSFIVRQERHVPQAHRKILSIISYTGCGLSLLGLTLTILTNLIARKLRRMRANQILVHMCVALIGALLLYVFGIQTVSRDMSDACKALSSLLHYFLVSAMAWTSVEAYNLYQDLVKVFDTSLLTHTEFMCRASIAGWVVPSIVVIITVVSDQNNYGFHIIESNNQTFCWMQQDAFYGAFLAPVLLLVVGNTVVFVFVMREIYRMPHLHEKRSRVAQFRASISVFVLFGLNWVFAGLAATTPTLVMQYLFTITCSFQGFMIFILHGLMKKDFREAWKLGFGENRVTETFRGSSLTQKTHSTSMSRNSLVHNVTVTHGERGGAGNFGSEGLDSGIDVKQITG
ncbi:adhesion G-protein coupled receptor G2 [Nematostella vectensis]|uniref:adhesion G-protein coupled receptor G2 n=1 Tax=Nematostella vectensis TaxID=45351 RepID=UPI001390502E|nr:adhesion G-protein coupled receptor G2 [Nematostella vectensis]XP_032219492.1 adhesion G-protein coupled receptor G2 [Nematostella vectensis]XP_048581469.1 adhesion G-protein coupled receptor G2 [Nematostella vectensis]